MLNTYTRSYADPKQPSVELKVLPNNIRYDFLDKQLNRPIIVSANLNDEETKKLLMVLRKYPAALGYIISDLRGISPSVCMHIILLEEDSKTFRKHKRRRNPIISDVVRKEVLKLLEARIIYPISDNQWASPVLVVLRKEVSQL